MMKSDEYGRVTVDAEALINLIHKGFDIRELNVEPSDKLDRHNKMCRRFNRRDLIVEPVEAIDMSPEEYHRERSKTWFYGNEDIIEFLVKQGTNPEEDERIQKEIEFFDRQGLIPMLAAMKEIIDLWREEGIVWGVGRGSSVASYLLFLIGVHRIDPMKYGLELDYE